MAQLTVRLLGRFRVCRDEQALRGLEARKVQELFCYLLLHRGHPQPREVLASLLWGDTSTEQSRKYLRHALWQLQTAVDPHAERAKNGLVLVEPEWVALNPQGDLWLDVADFEKAYAPVEQLPSNELDSQGAESLQKAAELYQGDLLEGWFLDWCEYERHRLQTVYLAMLYKLMGYCETHQQYETGLMYGQRVLGHDRACERTHRRLMRLHYHSGDRTAAMRQYERCATALEEELGARPSQRTQALFEQIRADQLDEPLQPQTEPRDTPESTPGPLSETLSCLNQLLSALGEIQRHVQQQVQTIERSIKRH